MEEIIRRYEALTSSQKELCNEAFKFAYYHTLILLKEGEEDLAKIKDIYKNSEELNDLNEEPEIRKKRKLIHEQFLELGQLETEIKWIPLLLYITD
jgi:hypothetical protein